MITIRPTIAAEINRHHDLACLRAAEAIDHAAEAGKLLLEAKGAVPHGQWLPWLQENIRVTPRQAQRYMQVAQGRPLPVRVIRANTTSVSHLPAPAAVSQVWPAPTWQPGAGLWHIGQHDGAGVHVVPALGSAGFFHVSLLRDDTFDGTRKPVRGDVVAVFLQHLGVAEPGAMQWQTCVHEGLLRPFGEPEDANHLGLQEAA